jgi:hypothetical protein
MKWLLKIELALVASVITRAMLAAPISPPAMILPPPDTGKASAPDTDAFAPGNRDFARFTNPRICAAAVQHATDVARRDLDVTLRTQMLRDTAPEHDTLPGSVIAIAQRCGARFTISNTSSEDLPGLMILALQAGNGRLAREVVLRQLALAPNAQARQNVLVDAVERYLAAEPARLQDAAWAAAKADTLALAEHTNSLNAHLPILMEARQSFDRARLAYEARQLIALGHALDFDAIKYYDMPLIWAWRNVFAVAFYDHPDSLLLLTQQAKDDLRRFPLGYTFPSGISYTPDQNFDFSKATPGRIRDFLAPFNPDQYAGDKTLPPVTAAYWYPERPRAWPPRDVVSLVVYGGWLAKCTHGDYNVLDYPLSGWCAPLHTYLREWTEQYAPKGLRITIVSQTGGEAVRSLPLDPQAEADSVNWYYHTYLKRPWTIAVVPSAIVQQITPQADGRRWLADTTLFGRDQSRDGLTMLYDRAGTLLYAGDLNNTLLHALIVRALAAPPTAMSRVIPTHR